MAQTSYSQSNVKQDLFVYHLFVERLGRTMGTFLDVGASHPTYLSNTYLLESLGWRGLCIDSSPDCVAPFRSQRVSPLLLADARLLDWQATLANACLGDPVTYLSLDCDEATLDIAKRLFTPASPRWEVLTVEHDAYRFGDVPRAAMHDLLQGLGYTAVAVNVCGSGDRRFPFENWYCDPKHVDPAMALEVIRSLGVVFDDEPQPVVGLHAV